MPGRLFGRHDFHSYATSGQSVPPASRNGGAANADVNGATIDLRGQAGAVFALNIGALTGAANVAARLQTNDTPGDETNGNWTNVNYTKYSNAQVTAKTNANSVFLMTYHPQGGEETSVRAVLVPDANISLAGITHLIDPGR